MPNVTKILVTDVSYLDDNSTPPEWKNVSAYDPTDVNNTEHPLTGVSAEHGIAYNNFTGSPVGGKVRAEINFVRLSIDGKAGGFTIFGTNPNQIPTTVKSPLIRFKIITFVNTTPVTETTSANYSYMMLKAAFDENPYDGQPGTTAVNYTSAQVKIVFQFPGFSASDISQEAADALKQLLVTPTNWELENSCAANAYTQSKIVPTGVNLNEYSEISADYGLGSYQVVLEATLNFPATGNYVVKTKFRSSEISQQFSVTGSQEISATVTQYTGSTKLVLIYGSSNAAFAVEVAGANA